MLLFFKGVTMNSQEDEEDLQNLIGVPENPDEIPVTVKQLNRYKDFKNYAMWAGKVALITANVNQMKYFLALHHDDPFKNIGLILVNLCIFAQVHLPYVFRSQTNIFFIIGGYLAKENTRQFL